MFGTSIKLDKALYAKVKRYADLAGYSSVDEFVTHALEKEIAHLEDADLHKSGELAAVVFQLLLAQLIAGAGQCAGHHPSVRLRRHIAYENWLGIGRPARASAGESARQSRAYVNPPLDHCRSPGRHP